MVLTNCDGIKEIEKVKKRNFIYQKRSTECVGVDSLQEVPRVYLSRRVYVRHSSSTLAILLYRYMTYTGDRAFNVRSQSGGGGLKQILIKSNPVVHKQFPLIWGLKCAFIFPTYRYNHMN